MGTWPKRIQQLKRAVKHQATPSPPNVRLFESPDSRTLPPPPVTPIQSHPFRAKRHRPLPAALYLLAFSACASTATQAPAPEPPQLLPLTGSTLRSILAAQPGPLVLLNVWSSWCAPCVKEMPDLMALHQRFTPRVQLVLVTIDRDQAAALQVLKERGVSIQSYIQRGDTQAFIESVHPKWSGTLPVTVIFDRQGQRLGYWRGPIKPAQVTAQLEKLLAQRSALKTPR